MKSQEVYARQDEAITAATLILDMIPAEEKLHWYSVAEFASVNEWLDKIEAPRGDDKSQRELLVAGAVELLRRATALRPVRVKVFEKKQDARLNAQKPA